MQHRGERLNRLLLVSLFAKRDDGIHGLHAGLWIKVSKQLLSPGVERSAGIAKPLAGVGRFVRRLRVRSYAVGHRGHDQRGHAISDAACKKSMTNVKHTSTR